jgi:polysaccharide pyruvyl transferase WcaK-like protein
MGSPGLLRPVKRTPPTKISFFGHFGSANSGNEATLLAVLTRLRLLFPTCEFCCICSSPENVIAAHHIQAAPHTIRSVRIWDQDLPPGKRLRTAALGLVDESREYIRAWRTLKGTTMFIVPGTGLLTDAYALPGWGPYGVFKWTLMAKLRRCRVVFLSVGAGPIRGAPGRLLVRAALSLADYTSYRDARSKEVAESLGLRAKDARISPDLVFGLSPLRVRPPAVNSERRPVVGLGLMEYAGKYSVANPRRATYERYLESLAVFVRWLLRQDYDIKLLLGDADPGVIDDLRAVLRRSLGSGTAERVTDCPTYSPQELLLELATTDLVVATRFHNVLMSLLLDKPVIAITFHHKCSSLMNQMGLSDYCHDINRMNARILIRQFQDLVRDADDVKQVITQRVAASKRALDEQYELLFSDFIDQRRAADVIAAAT